MVGRREIDMWGRRIVQSYSDYVELSDFVISIWKE